ncbi:MAG TPA: hypothetical protein VM286_03870 [Candidatus Thermoplasmatota archaeon]|nr:hypothetical protein [Candidatus Thermoplasmatota archaeon]
MPAKKSPKKSTRGPGPKKSPPPPPPPPPPGVPDLDAFIGEMKTQFGALAKQFKEVADQVGEEAQYHFDKELARALAKHPDLYAEVRKTIRQVQKTVDKAAETLGLKDTK